MQGGNDTNTPAVRFDYGASKLMLAKRRFAMEYIECGNHQLICDKDNGAPANLAKVMQHSFDWFLGKSVSDDDIISVVGNW